MQDIMLILEMAVDMKYDTHSKYHNAGNMKRPDA